MYERCLTEAERVLASSHQVAVPVKEVWGKVSKLSRSLGFETASLADFTAMLEADRRFEILPSQQEPEDVQPDLFSEENQEESELEQLGFYKEDRVKLRRVVVRRAEDDEEESPIVVKGMSSSKRPVANESTKRSTPRTAATAARSLKKKKAAPAKRTKTAIPRKRRSKR